MRQVYLHLTERTGNSRYNIFLDIPCLGVKISWLILLIFIFWLHLKDYMLSLKEFFIPQAHEVLSKPQWIKWKMQTESCVFPGLWKADFLPILFFFPHQIYSIYLSDVLSLLGYYCQFLSFCVLWSKICWGFNTSHGKTLTAENCRNDAALCHIFIYHCDKNRQIHFGSLGYLP